MGCESPLAKDSSIILAWEEFKTTGEYKNSLKWARHSDGRHTEGSLWAMFIKGFMMATEHQPRTHDGAPCVVGQVLYQGRGGYLNRHTVQEVSENEVRVSNGSGFYEDPSEFHDSENRCRIDHDLTEEADGT